MCMMSIKSALVLQISTSFPELQEVNLSGFRESMNDTGKIDRLLLVILGQNGKRNLVALALYI